MLLLVWVAAVRISFGQSNAVGPGQSNVQAPQKVQAAQEVQAAPDVRVSYPQAIADGEVAAATETPKAEPVVVTAPIYMNEAHPHAFRFSVSASSGYDSAVDDLPLRAGGVTTGEGYLGVLYRKRHFTMLLQHDAMISRSIGAGLGVEQYQSTLASLAGERSRKTSWTMLLENGYGTDSARMLGGVNGSVLNASAVPDQNAVAFGLNTAGTLSDHALFSVEHRVSAERTVTVDAGAYYHRFFNAGLSDRQYSLGALVRQRLTRWETVGVRADAVEQSYQTVNCTTGLVGLYSRTEITRHATVEATAGPTWGTAPCGGSYQYSVLFSAVSARGRTMYAGASQHPSDGLVRDSGWENAVFGGVAAGQPLRLLLRVDSGYAKYTMVRAVPGTPELHGYFVSGELRHRLAGLAEVSLAMRHFARGPGLSHADRSTFLLTYTWSRQDRPSGVRKSGAAHERP